MLEQTTLKAKSTRSDVQHMRISGQGVRVEVEVSISFLLPEVGWSWSCCNHGWSKNPGKAALAWARRERWLGDLFPRSGSQGLEG